MFFASAARLSFGLALASSVAAKVYDIQVGDASGSLAYSPEAIVRLFRFLIRCICSCARFLP